MQMKCGRKFSSFILCMALMVAVALSATGCGDKLEKGELSANTQKTETTAQTSGDEQSDYEQLGEGSTEFLFTVVDKDGGETRFEIHTDKEIVGEALTELGLIAGEESEYGLYVETVNGITADYNTDGVYWAFYINDEYALSGVDSTAITEGDVYAFKVE